MHTTENLEESQEGDVKKDLFLEFWLMVRDMGKG